MSPFHNYSTKVNSTLLPHNPSNCGCQIYKELPHRAELPSSTRICFRVYCLCYVLVIITSFLHRTELERKRLDNSHHISICCTYTMCHIPNSQNSPVVINKERTHCLKPQRLRRWFVYFLLFFQSLTLTISPTGASEQESLNNSTILERTLRSTINLRKVVKVDSYYLKIVDGNLKKPQQELFANIRENGSLELSHKPNGELALEYWSLLSTTMLKTKAIFNQGQATEHARNEMEYCKLEGIMNSGFFESKLEFWGHWVVHFLKGGIIHYFIVQMFQRPNILMSCRIRAAQLI
ncbi:unnamed protein product [Rodentolepis nana]|uniref:SCP domain-containing protein n=1 Tax=Rodentolepis nana TaxID=102285 RepID=A0A0R3TFW2_RODNA|nr:unnamed protein product [Rodentolepis nana]